MDNNNNWNWNDGDARRVSSVYQDEDETNAFILVNPPQNIESQTTQPQTAETQTMEQSQAVTPQTTQPKATEQPRTATPQNTEPQNIAPQIKQPQITESTPIDAQPNGPQPEFHPVVLPPNTRQYDNYDNYHNHNNYQNNKDQTNRQSADFNEKDISENKGSAIAAYLLGPIGIIIALLIARDSAYTAFHVRQALKITICSVLLELFAAVFALFGMIPLVGIIFRMILVLTCAAWFGVLILRLIAIAQVSRGEAKEPAIIGSFTFLK